MLLTKQLLLAFLLLFHLVSAAAAAVAAEKDGVGYVEVLTELSSKANRDDYVRHTLSDEGEEHVIHIRVQQKNVEYLQELLLDLSDVTSSNYGKHLSHEEVQRLTSNAEATEAVRAFLAAFAIDIVSTSPDGLFISASSTMRTLSSAFRTNFYQYTKSSKSPKDAMHKRDVINRALGYSLPAELSRHIESISGLADLPVGVYLRPRVVKQKIAPVGEAGPVEETEHGRRLTGYVTPSVLKSSYGITGAKSYSSRALQGILSTIGQTYSSYDLYLFQVHFSQTINNVRAVNGHANDTFCRQSKNIDDCLEVALDTQYMTAVGDSISTFNQYIDDSVYSNPFLAWIQNVSSSSNVAQVYSMSYASYEIFISLADRTAFDTEAVKLGVRGVTIVAASGDDGVAGYLIDGTTYTTAFCGYYAMWPAASQYVLAVGGTQGPESSTTEIACSASTSCGVTTGGGFSRYQSRPSWQASAVKTYFSTITTQPTTRTGTLYGSYNSSKRGYPDLSMASNLYQVVVGGYLYGVSGTSASAPVLAAVIALVNSYRLSQGWSSVGFVTPTIYSAYAAFVKDVTSGDNKCTKSSSVCCTVGFTAASGWDPVTGLGSVDYASFLSYFSSQTPGTPSAAPTAAPSSLTPSAAPIVALSVAPSSIAPTGPTTAPTAAPSAAPNTLPPTIRPTSAGNSTVTTSSQVSFFGSLTEDNFIVVLVVLLLFVLALAAFFAYRMRARARANDNFDGSNVSASNGSLYNVDNPLPEGSPKHAKAAPSGNRNVAATRVVHPSSGREAEGDGRANVLGRAVTGRNNYIHRPSESETFEL